MIVIGLTGRAGAGKSLVASHLVDKYGFTRLSFAGPLKKMLRTLDPILEHSGVAFPRRLSLVLEDFGSEAELKKSPYGPDYRRLMQVLGTDCIRAVDKNFWVRIAVAQMTDPNGKYVFDDVRFPNEAHAIQIRDSMADAIWHGSEPTDRAFIWQVVRPDNDGGAGDHESEVHADTISVDKVLLNDSNVENLKRLVEEAYE